MAIGILQTGSKALHRLVASLPSFRGHTSAIRVGFPARRLVAPALILGALTLTAKWSLSHPSSPSLVWEPSAPLSRSYSSAMAWMCSAESNDALIDNLKLGGLVQSPEVEAAMRAIDRKHYVTANNLDAAYGDHPLPIGYSATISAPHMHAMCLELLKDHLKPGCTALDVGSGSGYLTAVMAAMVAPTGKVYGIEHVPQLVDASKKSVALEDRKITDCLELRVTDGRLGYPDKAPYDAIHVGAAAPEVPRALLEQMKVGGKMVIPVGPDGGDQELVLIEKTGQHSFKRNTVTGVRYVPLTDIKKQESEGHARFGHSRHEGSPFGFA